MFKIVLFVGFLSVLQLASCSDMGHGEYGSDTLSLNRITKKAEETYGDLHENILKAAGVSSDGELRRFSLEMARKYNEELKELVHEFSDEVRNNAARFESTYKAIVERFNEKANNMEPHKPTFAAAHDTIENGVRNILDEADKLRHRVMID